MGLRFRAVKIIEAVLGWVARPAEDPQRVLKEISLDIEETLAEVRVAAARALAERNDLRHRLAELDRASRQWEEKAEIALSRDREDLARAAVTEMRRSNATAAHIQTDLRLLEAELRRREKDIEQLDAKLWEVRLVERSHLARTGLRSYVVRGRARVSIDEASTEAELNELRARIGRNQEG